MTNSYTLSGKYCIICMLIGVPLMASKQIEQDSMRVYKFEVVRHTYSRRQKKFPQITYGTL